MKPAALSLAGSALLVAANLLHLPPPRQLLRPTATPFDRSLDAGAGPAFVLLTRASALIPEGASVAVRAASPLPAESAYCFLMGASLLPGREVRRAPPARYLVVIGGEPPPATRGKLLLRTPQGTLWKLEG